MGVCREWRIFVEKEWNEMRIIELRYARRLMRALKKVGHV